MKGHFTDFFRISHTAGRNLITDFLDLIRGKTLVHRCVDDTTRQRIDSDAAGSQFFCQCFCKSIDAAFSG